jgi:hypothetical protein
VFGVDLDEGRVDVEHHLGGWPPAAHAASRARARAARKAASTGSSTSERTPQNAATDLDQPAPIGAYLVLSGAHSERAGSTRSASSSLATKVAMSATWSRITLMIWAVEAFPTRSHTTFGGGPWRNAS